MPKTRYFLSLALALVGAWAAVPAPAQTLPSAPPADSDLAAPPPAPATLPAGSVSGMGDINLYPKRVVIDEHNRVASIGLYNRTTATGDYDLTVGDMMMTEDGRLVDLAAVTDTAAKARVRTASGFLRWSPHRVTLPGSEAQMVRVIAHVPPDLPPGEYRAHFSAIAVPPVDEGLSIQQAANQTQATGIGVRIVPRFGIAIPVIVRVGQTTLTVGFTDISLGAAPGGGRQINFTITRDGTRSAFGDITVTPAGGRSIVAQIRGIGVYTELARRFVHIPIDPKADPRFTAPGARLTITYTDDDVAPGKVLARAEFTVP